ncbi:hypothetical protein BDV98DRAFT_600093 [Pterulicium gracile]|uniref:Cytochrome P450 n=1 Tax=Pterulicium gracile TaxID=1884261 RepID=A0A5C3R0N1_9AGAR|nr:hypothetical protein BDV98DRAFT_600093 [Pterula gracilis]
MLFVPPLALALVNLLLLSWVLFRRRKARSSQPIILSSPHAIRQLLKPSNLNEGEKLQSRAYPNKRLVQAFGIRNTFVSPSTDVHTAFRSKAQDLIKPFSSSSSGESWEAFYQLTTRIMHAYLDAHSPRKDIGSNQVVTVPFDPFIRCITFTCILLGLLQISQLHPSSVDFAEIDHITSCINEMWTLSKTPAGVPEEMRKDVNRRLIVLFRDDERFPNPLDFVIPTWETLWRTVAHTLVLSLTHPVFDGLKPAGNGLHPDTLREGRNLLASFADLHRDTSTLFGTPRPEEGPPSPESIVLETMRLHPPSRRIARARIPRSPSTDAHSYISLPSMFNARVFRRLRAIAAPTPDVIIEKADIYTAQRSPSIWGPTAAQFDPFRLNPASVTQEQKEALLMFGYGSHMCVARKWAPVAVGVIMEALAAAGVMWVRAPGEGGRQEEWEVDEGRRGWVGWEVGFDRSRCGGDV